MPPEATLPRHDVNVPGDYFSLAGFEVIMYGRFWVLTDVKVAWMSKDHRNQLRELLTDTWEKAQERIRTTKEEREGKHQDWVSRMNDKVERLSELLEKNEDITENLRSQIDDLEEKAADARTDEFPDMVRAWIQEKYAKIDDIEKTNQELTEKIEYLQEKLREE